jgi:hypothetical protein
MNTNLYPLKTEYIVLYNIKNVTHCLITMILYTPMQLRNCKLLISCYAIVNTNCAYELRNCKLRMYSQKENVYEFII